MDGGRLEHRRLAGEERMFPSGLGQDDAPRKAEFSAARIGAHLASGRRDGDLQPPATSEERDTRFKYSPRELHLTRDRRAAVIDVERRTGDGDAVVAAERNA